MRKLFLICCIGLPLWSQTSVLVPRYTGQPGAIPVSVATTTGAGNVSQVVIQGTANEIEVSGTCTITTTGTCTIGIVDSPILVTPNIGAATATSINGLTITSSTGTLTITNAKTFAVSNSLTLSGSDSTTINFPTAASVTTDNCVKWSKSGSILSLVDNGATCGSGGSSAFSALTTSTNTTATMTVGTGAAMTTSGSGTIAATSAPIAGLTGAGTGILTWLVTPSGANLATALTTSLPNTKGGTGGDSSAATGIAHVASGTWSYSTIVNADISSSAAIVLSKLATQSADTIVMNATGGSAAPTAVAAPSGGTNGCAGTTDASIYNSSTHAWGCHQITGGTGDAAAAVSTSYSATPTFTANSNTVNIFSITLTGNVTSCTIASATTGQVFTLKITQDGSGGHTFACSGFTGLGTVDTTASQVCTQDFRATSSSAATATGPMVCPGTDSLDLIPGSGGTAATFPAGTVTLTQTVGSGTKALATSAIASQACSTDTVTVTGAVSTDVATIMANADITAVTGYAPLTTGGLSIYWWITSNTLNIKACNPTTGSITPGAVSLNWRISR